jgi:glycosyltransferase involved in cell wall biosynthesis
MMGFANRWNGWLRQPVSRRRAEISTRGITRGRPDVCLVCPFDLDRPSGSPLRARATLEALRGHAALAVIATSSAHGAEALDGIWSRDNAHLAVRRFTFQVVRRLFELRPRVVHSFTPLAALPAILARQRIRDLRVVLEYHGPAEYELAHAKRRVRVFFSALDRWTVGRADAVIAMSRPQRRYLEDRCRSRNPPLVSWGPVDLAHLPATPVPANPIRTFGYFGNASFWQGVQHLVEAAQLVPRQGVRVVLGGVEPDELPRGASQFVIPRGRMSRTEMLGAMADCDVLVSPRLGGAVGNLQYPFKLSAYLAAGRPVLGTDVGDQGQIIRSARCGAVVAPEAPAELAAAIEGLAGAPPTELRDMGARARAFAEKNLSYGVLREQLGSTYGFSLD